MEDTLTKLLATTGLLVASTSSLADYSSQLALVHIKSDSDLIENTSTGLGLNYFFSPIKTDILHRYIAFEYTQVSSLGFGVIPIEIEEKDSSGTKADGNSLFIIGRYAIENTPILLGLRYSTSSFDAESKLSSSKFDIDRTTFEFGAKYYAENYLVIQGSIEQGETESKAGTEKRIDKGTTLNLEATKLFNVSSMPLSLNFGLSQIKDKPEDDKSTTNTNLALSATLITSNNIAFNAELAKNSGDDKSEEGKTLGFGVALSPTDLITIEVSTSQFSAKGNSEDDKKEIAVGVIAQF